MAKRRMNGEGTIYQRKNGLWVCEITLGYDKDKKRIKKTVSSMDKQKLQKKINDLKYLNDRHLLTKPSDYTVAEWINIWLDTYKKGSIKPTTYDMYYHCLKKYIEPQIGHYKIDALNSLIVQNFINSISNKGIYAINGLSQSSIKKIYITLSQAYKQAIAINMLHNNPCDGIQLPKKPPKKALAFTLEEQQKFLSYCKGDTTFENMFIFTFNTGMRMGEVLALTWEDIDFKNKIIQVNKNISVINDYDENSDTKTKTIINTTKTDSSTREIPLTKEALGAIKRQEKNNENNSPFVFYSTVGTVLMKRNIYRAFNKILEKSEINSPLTFHSIRHSFATRLLEKGADIKTVSELLGHKSIQITLDIYSHVSANLKRETIALLE